MNADTRVTKRHDLLANDRATAQYVFTLAKLGARTQIPLRPSVLHTCIPAYQHTGTEQEQKQWIILGAGTQIPLRTRLHLC